MKHVTRRLGLQIIAGAAAAPAAAATAPLANPDAELIELGRRFVEIARLRDAASEESGRLLEIARRSYPQWDCDAAFSATARDAYVAAVGAAEEASGVAAAEEAFEDAMDQLRTIFARIMTMRPKTIEGMRAIASVVLHFEWDGKNVEFTDGAIEGVVLAVLVAGLLDKPLPDHLPDWAAAWI